FGFIRLARAVAHWIAVRNTLKNVPGPRSPSWLWGHEWLLYHSPPGSHYVDWHKRFGKVVKFAGAFGHQVLSITDPRAVTYILSENIYLFPKPDGVREWFKATTGEGILWVEGKEAHEKQRRSLAPALNAQSVRDMTPIFYETSTKMANQWSKLLEHSSSEEVEIEITNWAGRYALDTVGRAAFSHDFNCLNGESHALAESLHGLTNNENKLSSFYMRALFWIFPSILSIGAKGEMIRKSKLELGAISRKMWQDAKIVGDERKNIMSAMLKFGDSMTEEEVVSQMRTIISAGYEPVSGTVSWVLYELAINKDLQQALREEVLASGEDPSFDALNSNFSLLDAVVKETLRMHPPILENHHVAEETITIPLSEPIPGTLDRELVIPKGTILEIPVNIIQTDPEVWGPDADRFWPQRWIERKEKGIKHTREIFAFSEGPRSCTGRVFAICEIKASFNLRSALIITLLRRFSFSCTHEIEAFQSFVIRPRIIGEGASSLPLLVRKVET
ncbi:cytochrome P450, partial [Mucidula mucida]